MLLHNLALCFALLYDFATLQLYHFAMQSKSRAGLHPTHVMNIIIIVIIIVVIVIIILIIIIIMVDQSDLYDN